MQPTLTTPRLVLRPRRLADTDACLAMDNEPRVTRYVTGPWSDPAEHRAFIEARTRGPYREGLGYWTLRLARRPSPFMGWVLLIPEDARGPKVEIGWPLRPAFWGAGYASEAAAEALRHAFWRVGLDKVVADIDASNSASIAVARRIGLIFRGFGPGGERDWRRFSLTRAEAAHSPGLKNTERSR